VIAEAVVDDAADGEAEAFESLDQDGPHAGDVTLSRAQGD